MNDTIEKVLMLVLLFLFTAFFASVTAHAAGPARPGSAQMTYQYDRADCMSGLAGPDRTTCLREAGAALNEAKRGQLADPNTEFERNRVARCDYLKGPDRDYCLRRMAGEGTVSGSVEGGGILRELVVTVPE